MWSELCGLNSTWCFCSLPFVITHEHTVMVVLCQCSYDLLLLNRWYFISVRFMTWQQLGKVNWTHFVPGICSGFFIIMWKTQWYTAEVMIDLQTHLCQMRMSLTSYEYCSLNSPHSLRLFVVCFRRKKPERKKTVGSTPSAELTSAWTTPPWDH